MKKGIVVLVVLALVAVVDCGHVHQQPQRNGAEE